MRQHYQRDDKLIRLLLNFINEATNPPVGVDDFGNGDGDLILFASDSFNDKPFGSETIYC